MRQFRMPIQHSKNISKFKEQIGTILRDLKQIDEKEKGSSFSHLQACISPNKPKRKSRGKRSGLKTTVKLRKFRCRFKDCNHFSNSKTGLCAHLDKHSGFPLSCRKCRRLFNNNISFNWHLKFSCNKRAIKKVQKFSCTDCTRIFFSKQNLNRHLDGHKRNNCTYCDQVITNRKHLIQHLIEVHAVKLERAVHKCEECDKRYVKRRSLYYHKQQHHKNKFVCLECGRIFELVEELNIHQVQHEENKNFKCAKCNQKFIRRQQYLVHMKRHENYKCSTCNETFASKTRMMLHKQKGHAVEGLKPKFTCPDCGREFFQKSKLMFHLRKHTDEKPTLNCQYCEKTFQSPYAYYKHSTTISHEKNNPATSIFNCDNCGTQFPKKYLLEQHYMRMHKSIKEILQCQFCQYKTRNKANMARHQETHVINDIKRFKCDQCGKDFHNLASLKGHISYIHTQKKQLKCNKCEKTFKRNSELSRHQETHSDFRPHVCSICGQSYKRLTHLRRHEKSTHDIIHERESAKKQMIELIEEKPQPQTASINNAITINDSLEVPVITFVETIEPLALVKKKIPEKILIEQTYFDNINIGNNSSELNNIREEDIILDMSVISNDGDTKYFLSTQYTNDELIQEYINYETSNSQLVVENHGANVPSTTTSCLIFNNFFSQIDSNEFES